MNRSLRRFRMTFFLPTDQAGRVRLGRMFNLVLSRRPAAVIRHRVSFCGRPWPSFRRPKRWKRRLSVQKSCRFSDQRHGSIPPC